MSDSPGKDVLQVDGVLVDDKVVQSEEIEPVLPPKLAKKVEKSSVDKRLKQLEDGIYEKAMTMVHDTMCFADLDPERPGEVPAEWVSELKGNKKAIERRHRVARAAWMSPKEAPVALAIAKTVMVGVAKARAQENSGDKTLNVAIVQLPAAPHSYPTIDIDEEK